MGFFTNSELAKKSKKKIEVDQLKPLCGKCGLFKKCMHPKIAVTGEGNKQILIISEFITQEEDEFGIHLVGEQGEFLKKELRQLKISLHKDCWKIAAVNCRTPLNRIPTHKEISCCYPMVQQAILTLKPKVIILLGNIAITSIFGNDFSNRTILRWRGFTIPDEKFKCWILPVFAPYQLLKNNKDKNLHNTFKRDLKRLNLCLNKPFTEGFDYESYVTILQDFKRVKSVLKRVLKLKPTISFDYETTGLKPHRNGQKIVSIAFSVSSKKAFAFPFDFKSFWTIEELSEIKELWKQILKDKEIKKINHNSKYEDNWSAIQIGTRVKNIHWDAMLCQKILDNRAASTGLKFQTFIRYGVRPYDKIISPYLKSKNGEFNTVEKAPLKDLLLYNGLDCIYTHMLFKDQKKYLDKMDGLNKAYKFFLRGLSTMSHIQLNGLCVDNKYYEKAGIDLSKRIEEAKKYLTTGREATKFKEQFHREIKITSNQDLGKLFFDVLGKDPVYTDKGNYKTDIKTLESLKLPFVEKLLGMKKLEKARGTYLAQFSREVYKGKLFPFFDLHIPVTFRSSSSMPNFQNLPKRNAEIKTIIRKGIIPSKNSVLCEMDFSGSEVITSAAYHKDPTFIHDITIGDMHRDLAIELFLLDPESMNKNNFTDKESLKRIKEIRFYAKNNWTFAQFYGDWFGSCAPNLWENVIEAGLKIPDGSMTVKEHLELKGIYELGTIDNYDPTPDSFLDHCKDVEQRMWNERFPKYTQWKKDIVEFYQDYGFIETFFGFRFTGYMDNKQCANFPIQSSSFHLLLYSLIKVEQFIKKNKFKTKIVGTIHDSIVLDIPENEIIAVTTGIVKIVHSLKDKFKWLVVPMEMEIEISRLREHNGNFAEMKEFTLKDIQDKKYEDYIKEVK